jgi:hypothetical protein
VAAESLFGELAVRGKDDARPWLEGEYDGVAVLRHSDRMRPIAVDGKAHRFARPGTKKGPRSRLREKCIKSWSHSAITL